jgi:hypothetical protein
MLSSRVQDLAKIHFPPMIADTNLNRFQVETRHEELPESLGDLFGQPFMADFVDATVEGLQIWTSSRKSEKKV